MRIRRCTASAKHFLKLRAGAKNFWNTGDKEAKLGPEFWMLKIIELWSFAARHEVLKIVDVCLNLVIVFEFWHSEIFSGFWDVL